MQRLLRRAGGSECCLLPDVGGSRPATAPSVTEAARWRRSWEKVGQTEQLADVVVLLL
jgi:hypothetical protein